MELSGILSGLFAGSVIGLIARILVACVQPIGCMPTVVITPIVIAILVAIVASLPRRSSA